MRSKRVAIAGGGGVGGVHALTLARLGVTRFRIADFDTFDVPNFNRQVGAMVSTLGQPKVDVIRRMLLDVNPECEVEVFAEGINDANLHSFLDGADMYVDALDFFAFEIRQKTFALCARLGIPASTVAPLGMGAALLNFLPGQMTFEEYFQWGDLPETDKAVHFVVGLAPAGLHRPYLVVPEAGHGVMPIGCVRDLLFRFIDAKTDAAALPQDAACATRIPRPVAFQPIQPNPTALQGAPK